MVAVRDPLLHDLSLALYQLGRRMSAIAGVATPEGADRFAQQLDAQGLGLLRMGTRLQVLRVDRTMPPATRFELPAQSTESFPPIGPHDDQE